MTSVDWDEVKRLAADFQRAQLSSSSLTLSERNCIEIINKLVELSLLDVIHTSDGKEYITPQYLVKEIKDELYVSGGRINLIELSKTLNVDLSYVTAKAGEVERSLGGCMLLNGQLIDKTYTHTVAEEVNERLKTQGKVNITDLTRAYDLPSDLLQSIIEKNLGKVVHAKQDKVDSRLFFTEAFVDRNKAIVRGALSALTLPTSVSTILQMTEIEEREFYSAYDNLNEEKQILGALTAKQGTSTMFIPFVYTKKQTEWVDNFYRQNGYLEYDALTRLGISDAVSFIRRHFSQGGGLFELTTCAVGPQLLSQVNDSIEDTLTSGSYLDLTMLLPSVFEPEDVAKVLSNALKHFKSKTASIHTFCDTYLVTDKFLQDLSIPFNEKIIQKKAEDAVKSGVYIASVIEKMSSRNESQADDVKLDKKEERRKKASSGKGGGGTQGRETKTRSTKKKHMMHKGKDDDSDEEVDKRSKNAGYLELISIQDVESVISKNSALADEEDTPLISAIASHLQPLMNKNCIEAAAEEYNRSLLSTAGNRRKVHSELQEKLDNWWCEVKLVERAIKTLPTDLQPRLSAHLLKTTAADIVNSLLLYLSEGDQSDLTPEMRTKIINELSGEAKEPMKKLNKSLSSSIEEFLVCLENALPHADLIPRRPDKKKERSCLLSRRENLLDQVAQSDDPASLLHLVVLLLLQYMTQSIIHASPKFVPSLVPLLKNFLSDVDYQEIFHFQELVSKLLTAGEDEELIAQIKSQLNENSTKIKEIAVNYKKQSIEK